MRKNDIKKEFIQYTDYISTLYPEKIENLPLNKYTNAKEPMAKTFTFQVTDACNLACTYCYQINKKTRKMSFETAKMAVDKLLSGEDGFKDYINPETTPALIIEFIGGEPFLEIELIDKVVDYFRFKTITMGHPWANNFRISICSNGVLYNKPEVQKFLQKNKNMISFSVTVDGTKELHDSCRVFPDGRPSYDLAHAAALDWKNRGNYLGSKITIAPGNITYLADSLMAMVKDGYEDINANCVYEKGWTIEHATELYVQCKKFTNEFIKEYDNDDFYISLLNDIIGAPMSEDNNKNWCGGTGAMLAMDPDGNLFPCLRYMESSLGNNRPPVIIGNVKTGMMQKECEKKCVECLNKINRRSQSTDECFYCPIAEGCSWCSAYNYQEFGTADKRATYICEMHKARVLANVYYWNTYHKKMNDGKVTDLWVPRSWAVPIIGEKEYEELVKLTKELGGFVNENVVMIKHKEDKSYNVLKES